MKTISSLAALALAAAFTLPAAAQQAIKLIIPAPAGGGTDGFFRTVAREVEPLLNTTVLVMNVGGAGGTVGVGQVVRAAPDGTTLAAVWSSPITAAPHALKQSYRPEDLTPVIQISSSPYVLCVPATFPATTGPEFIAHLKANPDKYTYGNDGIGGTGQLATARIFRAAQAQVRDIPFKGAGDTLNNFLGGHVDIYVGSISPVLAHVKAGKVKCPLVTSAERAPSLPGASGLKDIGLAGEETLLWRGILAPKGLPADKIATLEKAFEAAVKTPSVRKFMEESGEQLVIRKGAELRKMVAEEYDALGKVAASLNIQKQ
jgi:tripartite-type tricarboxylate transporter receptor subunit TctC